MNANQNAAVAAKPFARMRDILFILAVTGVYTLLSNVAGGYTDRLAGPAVGVFILVAISAVGAFVSMLPGFKKLPMVFWVSLLAVVLSIPGVPGSDVLLSYTKQVNFLAITTPILAYGGLSLGKDMEAFRALSWRIVPVALAVAAGSFILSTVLAEIMLHLEGVF